MADLKKTGLVFKAEGQTEFVRSLKEINQELKQNDYEMQKAQSMWDKSTKTKEKLTDRLQHLTKNYDLYNQRLMVQQEELRDLENSENANADAIAKKKKEIAYTEAQMAKYQKRIEGVNKRLQSGTLDIEDFGKSLEQSGKRIQDVGKKLSIASAAVTGVGVVAAKTGIEFEKGMSEVAAVSGATSEQLEQLKISAREAGATTDKSAKDAADALKYMALAGWDVEDSQKALMPVLKLSSAANMDLGRTSDLVTDTMSVLGLEVDELNDYLDILAQTSRNSNTDVDQLGEAFLNVGGRLKTLNVSAEEGAVALGILADNGIKGSSAGKSLNAILANMTAPTGRAKKALDELNISAFDTNGEFIGIEETLKLVDEATKDLTQEQRNMYLSMIGGKEHTASLTALMSGLGEGFDNLKEDVYGANGALEDMYDTATDNTMGAINNLKSSMEELSLTIFDNLQPAIEWLVDKVQGLVNWLNSLDEGTQRFVVTVGMLIAVLGPVTLILGTIIQKVGVLIQFFAPLIAQIGVLTKAVAAFFGISVGWLAAIAAAVAVLGVIIYKNWESIKEWTSNLIDSMSDMWNGFKDWISGLWTGIKEFFVNIWTGVKEWFIELWESVFEPIADVFMKILDFYKNIGLLLIGLFAMGLETIWDFFEPFVTKIREWISTLAGFITSVFTKVRETIISIIDNIKNAWKIAIDFVKEGVIQPLLGFFSGIFTAIWNVISSVINKIRNAFTVMGDAVKTVFRGVRDTIVNIFSAISGIIKAPMNGVISLINKALGAMNKIKIPKWVPGVGGKGINFPMFPMLAKGGNLLGGSAIVGEAGPELLQSNGARTTVTPLSDGGGAKKRTIDIDYRALAKEVRKEFEGLRLALDSDGFMRLVDERLLEVL